MEQTTLKIALAGLMHDIGKFAQGCLDVSHDYLASNAGQYQPFRDGRHTHVHAVYTAAFIEQMADDLPAVFNSAGWGEEDSFINLAAGHHNPETPMQWLIAQADRISSGLDRAKFEEGENIAFQDFKKTRLLPILESFGHGRCGKYSNKDDFQWRYSLAPVSANHIFPKQETGKTTKADAEQEYKQLFDQFISGLENLFHKEDNVELWGQHFDSLLMRYTSMIPAARVGDVVHDVSLYDHARTTAAFAVALYLYHKQNGTMAEKAIRDNSPEKFLLVTGDFYGIQNFIFSGGGELKSNRSKILRGRSFAVSLFSELAADMLCRKLGLPGHSIVLNDAGKFTLLAPNTDKAGEAVCEVEKKINNWLFGISYGQSSMGIIAIPASPQEFHSGDFSVFWNERHQLNMEKRKLNKLDLDVHGGMVDNYLDRFNNDLKPHQLCPLCGMRPSVKETLGDRYLNNDQVSCADCRDHIMLGTLLVKGGRLAVFQKSVHLKKHESLLNPIFGKYQLMFQDNSQQIEETGGELLKLWNLNVDDDGSLPGKATDRLINGYVPVYTEADKYDERLPAVDGQPIKQDTPITFNHIAAKAKHFGQDQKITGTEALGILKADVDNLGFLMGCGLSKERFTLSRLATISRQLNNFFCVYLPHLLKNTEEFRDVYTVFAGGDDLFLIGPWNKMAHLALHLRNRFADYVCANDEITFSAGITVQKTHVPVDKLAEFSEEALEEAKNQGRNRITMFGSTVLWDDFDKLVEHGATMRSWLDDNLIAKGMMYHFNHLVELAGQEKALAGQKVVISDLECLKWRSMFKYSVTRNINSSLKNEKRQKAVDEVSAMSGWLNQYDGAVRIPLWHLLYEQR
ncbi:MAG: type III-A CRISPR-associated protein Cas10/Csm1 [Thermodesulfobacteriota bacterium]|nr:type III-A CRISPR-associated protein Cas10/Csm1 [Thermodesulfobacteriota bacterium]